MFKKRVIKEALWKFDAFQKNIRQAHKCTKQKYLNKRQKQP